ncbi:hypothetical protein BK126_27020 [Paenibacillus sp. FSL H7-0326]|uniref:AraC family transcriptional regulator n=1 Tax=Paenibacillus sp. FSL H7-0326 TaxID=1921144 RepID=UPI00096EA758|nr:AraC family transcriptional regulator [Paenibacillus sp. FSL H7-0326]OMC63464.1 hypothetical protein BK126_27020 [Paenibacillus sp. FSL H7-0326]
MDYFHCIQKVVEYIETHIEDDTDVDEAIRSSHVSKFHFYRLFKAIVGMTVHEYMKERKLSKAAEHLCTTNDDILTIATRYGFNSQEVFTRNFKKLFHCTPAAFRKTNNVDWALRATGKMNVDSLRLDIKSMNGKIVVNEKVEIIQDLKLIGIEREMTDEQAYSVVDAMELFLKEAERIRNIVNETIFRICYGIDYSGDIPKYKELIAVEVYDTAYVPNGMTAKCIEYAKVVTYSHKGRLFMGEEEKIINTYHFLYRYRIPYQSYELTKDFLLERYGADFKGPFHENSHMEISFSIR